jgi:shikimate kinase
MGSGKSSVGKALARHLGWPFMDLDDLIEQQEGRTVAEIFAEAGETEFRRIERIALKELLKRSAVAHVVALGGGAYAQNDNAEHPAKRRYNRVPRCFRGDLVAAL